MDVRENDRAVPTRSRDVKRQRAGDDWLAFLAIVWVAGAVVMALAWWLRI